MSLVFIDRVNNLTFVHRDLYGKRSLCLQCNETTGELMLSSIMLAPVENSDKMISFELEANATMVIDWESKDNDKIFEVFRHCENGIRPRSLRFKNSEKTEG
jgi:hypothetical protein